MNQFFPPALYLVATPIGNLGDISLRALELLKKCDILLCEDSRVTRKLLQFYEITPPHITPYHDYNGARICPKVLKWVQEGKIVALVSDAGTPLISDPGYRLVQQFQENHLPVYSLPGACAAITALSLSGLPTDKFIFLGFLPRKEKACHDLLRSVKNLPMSLIIYETAVRLQYCLPRLAAILGAREIVAVREMTKIYEQIRYFMLDAIPDDLIVKGEYVLIVRAAGENAPSEGQIDEMLHAAFAEKRTLKAAVADVTAQIGGWRNEIYRRALLLKAENEQ